MTLVKKKFRYICIYLQKDDNDKLVFYDFTNKFYKRFEGLFGSIDFYGSSIKIINVNSLPSKFVIMRCRLEYVDNVLLSLCFTNYSFSIFPVSGTIKQLKKKIQQFLSFNEFFIDS
ncbi:MAG: Rpp14/Pop5 family protein [Candidatus Nitrosocosmicus sp.]